MLVTVKRTIVIDHGTNNICFLLLPSTTSINFIWENGNNIPVFKSMEKILRQNNK